VGITKRRRNKLQSLLDRHYQYRSYCDDDVQVRRSGPHGLGLFAVRQFMPGELIVEVTGKLFSRKSYEPSRYTMQLNKKWYLEPGIPGAFANHSCNPNSELVVLTDYSLGIVAICNIESDTEICYDYRWSAEYGLPECKCGAPNCRGWVVAKGQIDRMRKIARRSKRNGKRPR
jgi:SET domain-containing protein